jgi:hypothetical protein
MEATMHDYEIRIITRDGKASRSYRTQQADIAGAICRASELKAEGQGVEIWEGTVCMYENYGGGHFVPVGASYTRQGI